MLLFAILLIPLLIAFYLILQQRRRRFASKYGSLGLASAGAGIGLRRHIPPILFLLGLSILMVGLARPQTKISLPRIEGTVILEASTDTYGRVVAVRVLRSIPLLDAAAVDAVRQWVYEPLLVNGRPRPVTFTVTVRFVLK